jgi:hypothetical protein
MDLFGYSFRDCSAAVWYVASTKVAVCHPELYDGLSGTQPAAVGLAGDA